MKINDIYTNLKETIKLKKESFLQIKENLEKNIDSLKEDLKEIDLKRRKKLKISKSKNINFDGLNFEKKRENIDLKKIIKNYKKISFLIQDFFSKRYFIFQNKPKILRILAYLFLFIFFVFLDKIIVENLVYSSIKNLYNIKYSSNIEQVEILLSKAKTKQNIADLLFIPFKIIPEKNIQNANFGIKVLQDISQTGLDIIDFCKANINFIKSKKIDNIYFANLIENSKPFLNNLEKNFDKILNNLDKIKIEEEKQNYTKLEQFKNNLLIAKQKISLINDNFDTFLNILGKDRTKKYLILFQNNDEIRPTGGFVGSVGFIEIFAGKIKSFEKEDIYALERKIKPYYKEKIIGPSGVNLLSQRLGLRDANAFIDYGKSSKAINYFLKKAFINIDGIIYINQKIVLDILKEVGKIDFGTYDTIITNKNFSLVLSLITEAKLSQKSTIDTPKQALFDFSKLLFNKIKQEKKYPEILKIIYDNISSRDIVFYSFNKKENDLLQKLGLNGEFDYKNETDFDYPFFISIGGNKSDRYIKRGYYKKVNIIKNKNSCDLSTSFEIILKNNFSKKDEKEILNLMKKFRIKYNYDLLNIMGKGTNISYIKVIIPEEAIVDKKYLQKYNYKLIDHKKFKTIEKILKTNSGEKSYFVIQYKLKNIDCNKNNIAIYKQAGIYEYDLDFEYKNEFLGKTKQLKLKGLNKDFIFKN